jgi:multisubunit Na+/H+ antiporter MnhF subunit
MINSVSLIFHSVALVIQVVVFCICVYRYKKDNWGKRSLLFIMCWSGSFIIFEVYMVLNCLGINKLL